MPTIWYRTPGGAVCEQDGYPEPEVPADCTRIGQAEYKAAVKAINTDRQAQQDADREAAARAAALVQEALTKLLPDADPSDVPTAAALLLNASGGVAQ
jgi:hypothetical protein